MQGLPNELLYGAVTQLGECVPCKDEVEGSSPSSSNRDRVLSVRACYTSQKTYRDQAQIIS